MNSNILADVCTEVSSLSFLGLSGGHLLGELLAGQGPQRALWRGQEFWSGPRGVEGFPGVLY